MKPERPWFEIKAQAGEDTAEILIYDEIGSDWFGEGVTAKQFVKDLAALDVANLNVRINSPGGSVFDGAAIFNAIKRHKAAVTTYIDGMALSIASVIAEAGDKVVMADNALFMIHQPFGMVRGTAEDMRGTAEALDKVSETIRNVYKDKSGKSEEDLRAAMDAETWYTAQEALDAGFVDEVGETIHMAAAMDLGRFGFRNAPPVQDPQTSTGASDAGALPKDAGKVLSQANYDKLAKARDQISEVLTASGGEATSNHDDSSGDIADAAGETTEGSGDTPVTMDPRVIELLAKRQHEAPEEDR